MRVTVDANVFFAAIIRDSLARRVLFSPFLKLNAPYFFLEELQKHRNTIVKKSRLSENEFELLMTTILKHVEIVPSAVLAACLPAAFLLVEDEKDAAYIAAAVYSGSCILSNDHALKMQNRIRVYTVEELAKELGIL